MTFLLRAKGRGRGSLLLTDEVKVRYEDKHRVKKIHRSPIGNIRELETTGIDKKLLRLMALKVLRGDGTRDGYSPWLYIRVGEPTKKVIRRLRDQERVKLEAKDAEIEEARKVLKDLRSEREAIAREAWQRGNVVTQKELVTMAEEDLSSRS